MGPTSMGLMTKRTIRTSNNSGRLPLHPKSGWSVASDGAISLTRGHKA